MQVFFDLDSLPVFKNAVVTIGSFDGVHAGHRRILQQVRQLADEIGGDSVVVTFEPHPRLFFKPADPDFKLITTLDEKIGLLAAAGISAAVVVPFSEQFSSQTAEEYLEQFLVKKFSPRKIVIGYDHRFGQNRVGDLLFLKNQEQKHGFQVVEIPKHEVDEIAVSSSKIRAALDLGQIAKANQLLGHPFLLTGRVVEGDKIGRSIGFPTANLTVSEKSKLIPPSGIYAAWAWPSNGKKYAAMLYIGSRPTLQLLDNQRIEVNLLDFDEEIYDEDLHLEIVDFIRADLKLDSLEALKIQIENDQRAIEKRLFSAEKKSPPSVAVVILNYNTRRHLEEFLPSVLKTTYPNFQLIVADNASPDDSVAFLKTNFPQIQLIENQRNSGFAGGYNEALARVEADYFVLLNSDVEVTPDWLQPLLEAMENDSKIAIGQPKILAWRDKTRFEYAGAAGGWIDFLGYPFCRGRLFLETEIDEKQHDEPQDCFWAAGAAMFIRADVWRNFGGFDADYFAHNEEIDFCWRVKRAGFRVICEPKSVVFHLGGGTLEYENPRKVFLNFRNSLFSIVKNEATARLFWVLPIRFLLDGLAGLMFFSKGKFSSVWAIVQAHFSFYGQFSAVLSKRRKTAQLVENQRIGPMNEAGIFKKSIVWNFYALRKKTFDQLKIHWK